MRRALVLLLASAPAPSRAAAPDGGPCDPGAASGACEAPKAALSLLQITRGKQSVRSASGACACAKAAPGAGSSDDPCECVELGYCTAAADPHFSTFDGNNSPWRVSMFKKE